MMVIEDDNDKVDVEDDTVNHNNDEDYGVMTTKNIKFEVCIFPLT